MSLIDGVAEDHVQKVFVANDNRPVLLGISHSKGVRKTLQHHARLNEAVELHRLSSEAIKLSNEKLRETRR